MISFDNVCVLIPTLNESVTISGVVTGFKSQGFSTILVIDGGSVDGTQHAAEEAGATVIEQTRSGKGEAVREALRQIDTEYVLMIDGDGTYNPNDAEAMLEPLSEGYDHVVGNRYARMNEDAMPRLNRFGNSVFNAVFRLFHRESYTDILSGYRAFTTESVAQFNLNSSGFEIETELAVKCARHNIPTKVIPVEYRARADGSDSNLHPLYDGFRILKSVYGLARMNNPLFFFGSLTVLCWIAASVISGYLAVEWVMGRVVNPVLAIAAAALYLFGSQTLMFGYLADICVQTQEEILHRLDNSY